MQHGQVHVAGQPVVAVPDADQPGPQRGLVPRRRAGQHAQRLGQLPQRRDGEAAGHHVLAGHLDAQRHDRILARSASPPFGPGTKDYCAAAAADDGGMTTTAPAPAPRTTYRSVFAVGQFRVLCASMFLYVLGFEFEILGLSVLVYAQTRSAFLAALAFAMGFGPQVIGGALFTSLADRLPPRARHHRRHAAPRGAGSADRAGARAAGRRDAGPGGAGGDDHAGVQRGRVPAAARRAGRRPVRAGPVGAQPDRGRHADRWPGPGRRHPGRAARALAAAERRASRWCWPRSRDSACGPPRPRRPAGAAPPGPARRTGPRGGPADRRGGRCAPPWPATPNCWPTGGCAACCWRSGCRARSWPGPSR